MIKMDRRNIGKQLTITGHKGFNGRTGKVVGFQAMRKLNCPIFGGKWCL